MILSTLLIVLALAGAAALFSGSGRGRARFSTIPQGSGRRNSAQDMFWETRLLAALNGNRAALERTVLAKQRQKPELKRWQLMQLVYVEVTRHQSRRAS